MAKQGTETTVLALPVCDIHKYVLGDPNVVACYDGKTVDGPWANMCQECFNVKGIGLGTGRGQRLIVQNNSKSTTKMEN